jgi:hypothetical protein
MDSLLADLQRERQQFGPTMTNDECVALINAVLWKNRGHGFKQPEKPGSGNNGRRRDGKLCSVDGIVLSNPGQPDDRTFIDALKDAGGGGKSIPAWQVRKIGSVASDGHIIGPWAGPMLDPVDPGGIAPLTDGDVETLHAQVHELQSEVTVLRSALNQARSDLQDALRRLDPFAQ